MSEQKKRVGCLLCPEQFRVSKTIQGKICPKCLKRVDRLDQKQWDNVIKFVSNDLSEANSKMFDSWDRDKQIKWCASAIKDGKIKVSLNELNLKPKPKATILDMHGNPITSKN